MDKLSAGDKFESSIGRVEVKKIVINCSEVQLSDEQTIDNTESVVNNGEVYVHFYSYVTGMKATAELSEFCDDVEKEL